MTRRRWDASIVISLLGLLVAVIALLFGDNLLRSGGDNSAARADPSRAEDRQEPRPAPPVAESGPRPEIVTESLLEPEENGASPEADADRRAAAIVDRVPGKEWCLAGVSTILGRVLDSVDRAELERLAASGNPRAQLLVGRAYLDGLFGFPESPTTSFSWLKRAASAGDPSAVNALGVAHFLGIGTVADPPRAVPFYRRAHEAGCAIATNNLARAYAHGIGDLPRDREEAVRLHRLAAAQGLDLARQDLTDYGLDP